MNDEQHHKHMATSPCCAYFDAPIQAINDRILPMLDSARIAGMSEALSDLMYGS